MDDFCVPKIQTDMFHANKGTVYTLTITEQLLAASC